MAGAIALRPSILQRSADLEDLSYHWKEDRIMHYSRLFGDTRKICGALLEGLFCGRSPIRIYEAGGGSSTSIPASLRERSQITVVDVSPEQLERCAYADVKVLGSCESWSDPNAFDLVVCNYVLEHVSDVRGAIRCFVRSLQSTGVVLIAVPRKHGLQGFVTRLTPHAFHVLYYRWTGRLNAGKPGFAPFETLFSPGVAGYELRRILEQEGCNIVAAAEHVGTQDRILKNSHPIVHAAYVAFCMMLRALTLGIYDGRHSDFWIIAQKK